MMDWLRDWIMGVTCTAMAAALLEGLAPSGSVKKVCRLAGGLALLIAALNPLLRLDGGWLEDTLDGYRSALGGYEQELEEQNVRLYKSIIEEQTAAYIVDKAEEMGISCHAEVTIAYDENGAPVPWAVTAWGDWREGQREELSRMLERDLGVPPQRQRYEEIRP